MRMVCCPRCASVCHAWHGAIAAVCARRVLVRHGETCLAAPRLAERFSQPTFLQVCPSIGDGGGILVADQHKLSILPTPPALPVGVPPAAAATTWGRLGEAHGGTGAGQLYHPHGVALAGDGRSVFVADRSNHRIQRLRIPDGAPLDASTLGMLSAPYGLATYRNELIVADANHDRIVVLSASDLRMHTRPPFGSHGAAPGQLDRPRGVAILKRQARATADPRWEAMDWADVAGTPSADAPSVPLAAAATAGGGGDDEVIVAEMGNNRCSVFSLGGSICRTFGDTPTAGAGDALPLRRPYDVHVAHGLVLVSEYDGRRLLAFSPHGSHEPLQVCSSYILRSTPYIQRRTSYFAHPTSRRKAVDGTGRRGPQRALRARSAAHFSTHSPARPYLAPTRLDPITRRRGRARGPGERCRLDLGGRC